MKMKTLAVFLAVMATSLLRAADFKSGDLYYNITSGSEPYSVEVTYQSTTSDNYQGVTAVTIPNSVSYNGIDYVITGIGERAFYGCSSLESIEIPVGVTLIGDQALSECSALTAITWNAKNCGQIWVNLTPPSPLPGMVGNPVLEDAFDGIREQITSFTLGDGVERIPDHLCREMSSLKSITLPKNLKTIGTAAFLDCSSLASITIVAFGSALVSIGEYAFAYCPSITSLTIPENVTAIGDLAFYRCTSLGTVILNEGLTSIGNRVFAYCPDLTDVYCSAEEVPTTGSYVFDYPEKATLHVPAIALEAYKTTAPWRYFGTIVAIEGEQPAEDWSEWTTLGTAVTASGKDAIMANLRHWGEGTIEEWGEPITIDQRTNKADPSKHQLRLNGIFNAKGKSSLQLNVHLY